MDSLTRSYEAEIRDLRGERDRLRAENARQAETIAKLTGRVLAWANSDRRYGDQALNDLADDLHAMVSKALKGER